MALEHRVGALDRWQSHTPQRVNSGTVPSRAGTCAPGHWSFPGSGVQVQLDVLALFRLKVLVAAELGAVQKVDALGSDGGDQVVRSSGEAPISSGSMSLIAVGEVAFSLPTRSGLDVMTCHDRDRVVSKLVVHRKIFRFLRKADSAPSGAGAQPGPGAKRNLRAISRRAGQTCVIASKEAASWLLGQDDKRFRFHLVAREPRSCSKVRTSSQRS